MSEQLEPNVDIDELIKKANSRNLILYNDNVNTFDWVIRCLMDHCNHSMIQSEQCAILVHAKGKCSVKEGSFDELQPIHEALSFRNLTVEIE